MENRVIILYDMDMYYAAVMIRDNPSLKGKPLIIGAKPHERGVVATSSYEARKYGVRSGMSSYEAYKLCPNGIFMHPKMGAVIETSEKIKSIVRDYSDTIEFVALDEAYIDITNSKQLFYKGDITKIGLEIKGRIFAATGCTCTVGVGYSKYAAKLAAEKNKPDGFGKIMEKKRLLEIITDESVRIIYGIGEQMEKRLWERGIRRVADIQKKSIDYMREHYGVYGVFLYYMSWGIDDREVEAEFEEAGIGNSKTLDRNISGLPEIKKAITGPLKMACYRLKHIDKYARNIMIKLRYGDFTTITRSIKLQYSINSPVEVYKEVCRLLETKVDNYNNIRLVGIRLSALTDEKSRQLSLFEDNSMWGRQKKLYDISYELRKKYGYDIIYEPIGTENEKVKGDENDIRRIESFGDYRTLDYIKRVYRKT